MKFAITIASVGVLFFILSATKSLYPVPPVVQATTMATFKDYVAYSEKNKHSRPTIMLVTNDNCRRCAVTEERFTRIAKRFRDIEFDIVDIEDFTGVRVPPEQLKGLPSLITSVSGQPYLYRHARVDTVSGGLEALVEDRARTLMKLEILRKEGDISGFSSLVKSEGEKGNGSLL